MSSASAFTPLEGLLTCQYLYNYGVSPTVFSKISGLLLNDDQIRQASSFDAGRLSPDALRDFYLRLLKDEARNEINAAHEGDGTNGDTAQTSRKRKAPSPSLPTIQEASKNSHLMPQLIQKLYARYREHATITIKEDERRFGRLRQNLSEIKNGAWDERLQKEIEQGQWEKVLKRKSPGEEKKQEAAGVNGAVKPPGTQLLSESKRSEADQRPRAPVSQNATPAISPRPSLQPAVSQSPAISPRPTPQPTILPAPGPSQQPVYAQHQHPPISPRPPESRPPSRPAQSPMLPPPPPSQTGSPLPPYPYANNAQLPPHSPYAAPASGNTPYSAPAGQYQQYGQQAQAYPPYAGAQGGVILQPFTVAPQTPTGPRQQQGQTQNAATAPQARPPHAPGVAATSAPIFSPLDIAKLLNTPITAKKLSANQVAPSPSKETQWKPLPARAATRAPRKSSPERPRSRSVSPISERAESPPIEPDTSRRSRRGKPLSALPDNVAPSRSARMRRVRGASTTSSVPGSSVRGRTRSQSVMSQAEDVSMVDAESVTGRRVKHEPSTPMESSDFVRPTTEGTPNQTGRRGFATSKRKRGTRDDSEVSDVVPLAPRQDKTVVIANRNFNRLSQTITNDVQSHKHASLFSNPVRDRDAEGYSDIIRRPQDLKSIRTAITAGNRAVNAATASDSFTSSTTSQPRDGSIVVLPVSEDLVPPKAIVNPGQLEKEVMRMFANAVMFNPGDDGVVHDAREMAKDVEAQIAKFREVERSSGATLPTLSEGGTRGGSEVEGAEEDSQVGSKRRKVG